MAELLSFPDRLGLRPARVQWEALRRLKMGALIAALVTKYPDCTFTSDELRAAEGMGVRVQMVASNEWKMLPITATPPTEKEGDRG